VRPRILVTRPEPEASATASRLDAAGFEAIVLPLTEIRALAADMPTELVRSDAAVATSANAIRHAPAKVLAILANKPCFAVGEETARAARDAGFRDVVAGEGDAAALAELVIERTDPGARLSYLTGRIRRDGFEQKLAQSDRHVEIVETYDTVPIAYSPAKLSAALAGGIDAVLLYSGKAAEALAALPNADRRLANATLYGLSERIGSALPSRWRKMFHAAGTPDEAALFKLLEAAFPPTP
jgi:uroporphyrinogen-III synthase